MFIITNETIIEEHKQEKNISSSLPPTTSILLGVEDELCLLQILTQINGLVWQCFYRTKMWPHLFATVFFILQWIMAALVLSRQRFIPSMMSTPIVSSVAIISSGAKEQKHCRYFYIWHCPFGRAKQTAYKILIIIDIAKLFSRQVSANTLLLAVRLRKFLFSHIIRLEYYRSFIIVATCIFLSFPLNSGWHLWNKLF